MILFRCPNCGAARKAEPQDAGGTTTCQGCGEHISIPNRSDPECALVYKAGDSEDGLLMTREDVRLKLISGALSETDLLWDGSTWRPLGETYSEIREGTGLQLKHPPPLGTSSDEIELAESLNDLAPIQSATQPSPEQSSKHKDAPASEPDGAGAADGAAGKHGTRESTKKRKKKSKEANGPHGKAYYVIQAVMGILAVLLGFKFGVGPLISRYRHRPSYVIVHNHENIDYVATLGWGHQKRDVYRKNLINFDIFVGMPERQTLHLKPKNAGDAKAFSVKVPLRPGEITLVNLKRKGQYGIYNLHLARDKRVDSPELKTLAKAIATNEAPTSAIKLSRQIRDLVAGICLGVKDDLIFRGSQYDFPESMLPLLKKKQNEPGKKAPEPPRKPRKPKPTVMFPAQANISFANGSAVHRPEDRGPVQRSILLPISSVVLNKSRRVKLSNPKLSITGNDKVIRLSIVQSNMTETIQGNNYRGVWIYRASCPLEGRKRGEWSWSWEFRSDSRGPGAKETATLQVDQDGRESERVTSK